MTVCSRDWARTKTPGRWVFRAWCRCCREAGECRDGSGPLPTYTAMTTCAASCSTPLSILITLCPQNERQAFCNMWRTWGGNASALTRNPHPTLRATFSFVIKEKGWGRGIRGGSLNSLAGFASQYFGYFLPSFRYVRVLGTLGGEVYESRRQ